MMWLLFLLIAVLSLVVSYLYILINRLINLFNKEFYSLKQKVKQIELERALEKDLKKGEHK